MKKAEKRKLYTTIRATIHAAGGMAIVGDELGIEGDTLDKRCVVNSEGHALRVDDLVVILESVPNPANSPAADVVDILAGTIGGSFVPDDVDELPPGQDDINEIMLNMYRDTTAVAERMRKALEDDDINPQELLEIRAYLRKMGTTGKQLDRTATEYAAATGDGLPDDLGNVKAFPTGGKPGKGGG